MTKASTIDLGAVGERMKLAREAVGLPQKAFCEKFGCVSVRTYQKNEAGYNEAGIGLMDAFIRAGINANWLLTGEGQMLQSSADSSMQSSAITSSDPLSTRDISSPGYLAIPFHDDVRASAGYGVVNTSEQTSSVLMFREDWIRHEIGVSPQNLSIIRVDGDSMEPTLRAGDVILINRNISRLDREGIYIIHTGGVLLVKRLQILPEAKVRVTSDNPAFEPWTVDLASLDEGEEFRIDGRVVWSGRRF